MLRILADWFIRRITSRKANLVIGTNGSDYLRRWHVIPKNPIFNIFLHHVVRGDYARDFHDHPWPFLSIILSGAYVELTPRKPEGIQRVAGDFYFRWASQAHRIDHPPRRNTYSLVITGISVRDWGFYTKTGWVPWWHYEEKDPVYRPAAGDAGFGEVEAIRRRHEGVRGGIADVLAEPRVEGQTFEEAASQSPWEARARRGGSDPKAEELRA